MPRNPKTPAAVTAHERRHQRIVKCCVNCAKWKRETMTPLNRAKCGYWDTYKFAIEVACPHYQQWEKANNTKEGSST